MPEQWTPFATSSAVYVSNIMQLARVIEQERSRAKAVVELVLSKEVLSVHFDDICEYVGDVEDMDM